MPLGFALQGWFIYAFIYTVGWFPTYTVPVWPGRRPKGKLLLVFHIQIIWDFLLDLNVVWMLA